MKPNTRIDNFLAKIAGDPDANEAMIPRSPEEYYLDQIAQNGGGGGGGGGLPTPTASDVGAGLVVKKVPVEGAVIVPEQTVVCNEDNDGSAECSDAISSLFTTGAEVIAKINGTSYTGVITDAGFSFPTFLILNGLCSFYIDDGTIYFYDDEWPVTATISLNAVSYTYEWGIDPYAAWDFVAKINWDTYSGEVVKGDYATVRTKLEAHTPCAFLVFGYGANNPTSDAMFTDVGYALNESAIFLQLSSGSGWLWYPNNTLESDD